MASGPGALLLLHFARTLLISFTVKGLLSMGTGGGGFCSKAVGGSTVVGPQCFPDRYFANSSAVSFMLHLFPSSVLSAVEWTA